MERVTSLTHSCGVNPEIQDSNIWPQESSKNRSMVRRKAHFDILNHVGMSYKCDRQTDGQMLSQQMLL